MDGVLWHGLVPDPIQGAAGEYHPLGLSHGVHHWFQVLADRTHKSARFSMVQGKSPNICCGKVCMICSMAASGAHGAHAVLVGHLLLLLSQSGHVPGPEDIWVNVGFSLAMRPRRSGWPRDSSLV